MAVISGGNKWPSHSTRASLCSAHVGTVRIQISVQMNNFEQIMATRKDQISKLHEELKGLRTLNETLQEQLMLRTEVCALAWRRRIHGAAVRSGLCFRNEMLILFSFLPWGQNGVQSW